MKGGEIRITITIKSRRSRVSMVHGPNLRPFLGGPGSLHEPPRAEGTQGHSLGFPTPGGCPIYFGRAEGTQVSGAGVLTPFPRARASLRPFSDPSRDLHTGKNSVPWLRLISSDSTQPCSTPNRVQFHWTARSKLIVRAEFAGLRVFRAQSPARPIDRAARVRRRCCAWLRRFLGQPDSRVARGFPGPARRRSES